jgi:hypothetical protein
VAKYVPDIGRAFVVSPDGVKVDFSAFPVTSLKDSEVLDIDRTRFAYRPNWIFQQMLKLFQTVTDDWYMVIDSDRFFNRRVDLWQDGKPVMLMLSYDQEHGPYFTFNQKMFGFGKTYPHSFLSECTLYSRTLILEMLDTHGYDTPKEFIEAATHVIDGGCYPAESELYGSWIWKYHPKLYTFKTIKAIFGGKYGGEKYTDKEIEQAIAERKPQDVDVFSLHSWEG